MFSIVNKFTYKSVFGVRVKIIYRKLFLQPTYKRWCCYLHIDKCRTKRLDFQMSFQRYSSEQTVSLSKLKHGTSNLPPLIIPVEKMPGSRPTPLSIPSIKLITIQLISISTPHPLSNRLPPHAPTRKNKHPCSSKTVTGTFMNLHDFRKSRKGVSR